MCIEWHHGRRGQLTLVCAWHYVLAQKEVRFDQIGKDLIIQDFKRLKAEAPRKATMQRLNMGQLRVDAMIWR